MMGTHEPQKEMLAGESPTWESACRQRKLPGLLVNAGPGPWL